jgi:colanic acid biosynthesis protein WcaH
METDDSFIPEAEYASFLDRMPQVCVELFVEHDQGILLCRRTTEPARGEWFWPGSRLFKGETLEAAAHRVAEDELGVRVTLRDRLGVYSHFWESSPFTDVDSTHTVNVVFRASLEDQPADIRLDDQHDGYRFVTTKEADLHPYVRTYLDDAAIDTESDRS